MAKAKPKKPTELTVGKISDALRSRFNPPEWVLFLEVGNATGGLHRRWADAVAMNTYPSKGLELCGFEIKVSRGDWLRELRNGQKSADMIRHLDRWYIVAPSGVVAKDELPSTWGSITVSEGGAATIRKPAPLLNAPDGGVRTVIAREFVAALLRQAHNHGENTSGVGLARTEGYRAGRAAEREAGDLMQEQAVKREVATQRLITQGIERGLEPLRSLEKKLGRELNRYNARGDEAVLRLADALLANPCGADLLAQVAAYSSGLTSSLEGLRALTKTEPTS